MHLPIADLDRAIRFHQSRIGLVVRRCEAGDAWLTAGGCGLLVLPPAHPAPSACGL